MRPNQTRATVRLDATRHADHSLSKERIAVYNSGLVPIDRYRRDASLIAATGPESLRIDLGWGAEWMPWTREVVRIEDGRAYYDFRETDEIAAVLNAVGTRPYWSYCYVPKAAREPGADWRTMGLDDSTWVETVAAYVAGMRDRGVAVGYHEVYNEPDLLDERTGDATFYTGGLQDYLDLYRATARAIRAADPHARIGGPALAVAAVNADWLDAFCGMVVEEELPLDFLSFHHYGHFGLEGTLQRVRHVVAKYPALRHVELHLNEYNAFSIDYPRGGLQDTHLLASTFAAELPRLLAQRDLTRTHWAQYLDSGQGNFSGMIDIDGAPKPVYAVYEFYQRMPIDRIQCTVEGPPGVGAIASSNGEVAAAIVWNRHFADVDLAVDLQGVTAGVTVSAIVIDADGVHPAVELPEHPADLHLFMPAGAVSLLTTGPLATRATERRAWGIPVTPESGESGWSDFDEATTTFRFGTGSASWTVHGMDLLTGDAVREWEVTASDCSGTAAEATVILIDAADSNTLRHHALQGELDTTKLPALPDPPRPRDSFRSFIAVTAPTHTFVTVAPRNAQTR